MNFKENFDTMIEAEVMNGLAWLIGFIGLFMFPYLIPVFLIAKLLEDKK